MAQLVTIVAADAAGAPWVGWLVAEHALVAVALIVVADEMAWDEVRLVAAASASLAATLWVFAHVPHAPWAWGMIFAMAPFAVFVVDAFRTATRPGTALRATQAAVVAGVVGLVLARHVVHAAGLGPIMGVVPAAQALVMVLLLQRVRAHADGAPGGAGRVALVAAATLGFATAAVPLQLSNEHVTVAWALEAGALAWLHRRLRFPQLVLWVAGVATAVFVRLALNPSVLAYHPRATTPIFNWYLYLYLVSAVALFAAGWLLRDADDRLPIGAGRLSRLLAAAGTVLLFLLLNIEIADFYATGPTLTFNFLSATLAQDLTYTIGWALFAIGILVAGLRTRNRSIRGAALALLLVSIVKCFLHDLWKLQGLYRVGSLVGLATCLALVAVLLQRFVFLPREEETP
jgi:uncharacterized membrane protein